MLQHGLCLSLLPLFSLTFSLSSIPGAISFIYAECSQVYFNSTTPYELNVNSLFSSLVNSASVSSFNEFEISTPPPENSQSAVVYGVFQCQGDLSYSGCQGCVANSVSQLKKTCPMSTGGTIQIEEGCFVKYDNASFFGVEDKMEVLKRCGPSFGYNSHALNDIDAVFTELIAGSGQYFHTGASGSIQGVAQCVQDLSVRQCEDCVLEARVRLGSECETATWGDMFLGKCYLRYADRGFQPSNGIDYNNNNGHGGGKGKANNTVIVRAIGIIVGVLFVAAGVSYAVHVSVTNVYNINVRNTHNTAVEAKKIADEAKRMAGEFNEKVKEVDQKAEAAKRKAKAAKKKAAEASTAASTRIS